MALCIKYHALLNNPDWNEYGCLIFCNKVTHEINRSVPTLYTAQFFFFFKFYQMTLITPKQPMLKYHTCVILTIALNSSYILQ